MVRPLSCALCPRDALSVQLALDLRDLLEQLAAEMVEALEDLVLDEAEPLLSDRFVLVVLLGVLLGLAALLPRVAEPSSSLWPYVPTAEVPSLLDDIIWAGSMKNDAVISPVPYFPPM